MVALIEGVVKLFVGVALVVVALVANVGLVNKAVRTGAFVPVVVVVMDEEDVVEVDKVVVDVDRCPTWKNEEGSVARLTLATPPNCSKSSHDTP